MAFLSGFCVMKKIVMGNQNISCCYPRPYRNDFTLKEDLHCIRSTKHEKDCCNKEKTGVGLDHE